MIGEEAGTKYSLLLWLLFVFFLPKMGVRITRSHAEKFGLLRGLFWLGQRVAFEFARGVMVMDIWGIVRARLLDVGQIYF